MKNRCNHNETREINVDVLIGLETRKMVLCTQFHQVLDTKYDYRSILEKKTGKSNKC